MSEEPQGSQVERVSYGKRETVTKLLAADTMTVMRNEDGTAVVDLLRVVKGKPVESYSFRFSAEDRKQLKRDL